MLLGLAERDDWRRERPRHPHPISSGALASRVGALQRLRCGEAFDCVFLTQSAQRSQRRGRSAGTMMRTRFGETGHLKLENVWQRKDLQTRFLDVWQGKDLAWDRPKYFRANAPMSRRKSVVFFLG